VQQTAPSFDDLIGTQENRLRKGQTNDPGGLEVDDQLKLGGLLDRQISGASALEYLIDIGRRPPIKSPVAYAV